MGTRQNKSKHGMTGTDIYRLYRNIKFRCTNTKDKHAKYYVNRGITMCEEWINDPLSFCTWALENGYKKGLTIDRIDNNKGYSPENCRFITIKEQCNNRRTNHFITIDNQTYTVAQWSEISGIGVSTIKRNIKKGYKNKDILKPEKYHQSNSKIGQYDLNGNLIKIWDSLEQIKKELGNKNGIACVCKHKKYHHTAFGYGWAYYPEDKWKPIKKHVRSDKKYIKIDDEEHTYKEWSKILNINIDHFRSIYRKYKNNPSKLSEYKKKHLH